jgi:predicted phage gp36 major capsid-like protein
MQVEPVSHMFHTSNNLPNGARGVYAHWRTGADSVNDAAFAMLSDKTSA